VAKINIHEDYKTGALTTYMSKFTDLNSNSSSFYRSLCTTIEEADKLPKTRRSRLKKLRTIYPVLVDGYLLYVYGLTYEELFNEYIED